MPKLSPEKRAELEAMLAADDADDEDAYEIEIRDGDSSVRMPRSKATPWLRKKFPDLFEELLGDGGEDEDAEPAKGGKKPPAADDGKVTRFGRRVS